MAMRNLQCKSNSSSSCYSIREDDKEYNCSSPPPQQQQQQTDDMDEISRKSLSSLCSSSNNNNSLSSSTHKYLSPAQRSRKNVSLAKTMRSKRLMLTPPISQLKRTSITGSASINSMNGGDDSMCCDMTEAESNSSNEDKDNTHHQQHEQLDESQLPVFLKRKQRALRFAAEAERTPVATSAPMPKELVDELTTVLELVEFCETDDEEEQPARKDERHQPSTHVHVCRITDTEFSSAYLDDFDSANNDDENDGTFNNDHTCFDNDDDEFENDATACGDNKKSWIDELGFPVTVADNHEDGDAQHQEQQQPQIDEQDVIEATLTTKKERKSNSSCFVSKASHKSRKSNKDEDVAAAEQKHLTKEEKAEKKRRKEEKKKHKEEKEEKKRLKEEKKEIRHSSRRDREQDVEETEADHAEHADDTFEEETEHPLSPADSSLKKRMPSLSSLRSSPSRSPGISAKVGGMDFGIALTPVKECEVAPVSPCARSHASRRSTRSSKTVPCNKGNDAAPKVPQRRSSVCPEEDVKNSLSKSCHPKIIARARDSDELHSPSCHSSRKNSLSTTSHRKNSLSSTSSSHHESSPTRVSSAVSSLSMSSSPRPAAEHGHRHHHERDHDAAASAKSSRKQRSSIGSISDASAPKSPSSRKHRTSIGSISSVSDAVSAKSPSTRKHRTSISNNTSSPKKHTQDHVEKYLRSPLNTKQDILPPPPLDGGHDESPPSSRSVRTRSSRTSSPSKSRRSSNSSTCTNDHSIASSVVIPESTESNRMRYHVSPGMTALEAATASGQSSVMLQGSAAEKELRAAEKQLLCSSSPRRAVRLSTRQSTAFRPTSSSSSTSESASSRIK